MWGALRLGALDQFSPAAVISRWRWNSPLGPSLGSRKVVTLSSFIARADCPNRDRRVKRARLETGVRGLEEEHKRTGACRVRRQLTTARKQLKALDTGKAEYTLLHLKQKFYAGGNKAGAY
ncbi:hypothetical protein NDU88_006732 [Pleurodeles waltl]|uniref:Uncharacterized protein n=1 Tax=Pleurodeles waltl TaxID=8319 RepID=A0AAV7RMF1_PLEWA|nr:hypothetical protein NDU88_006732 [Pleurodeles waltl]